MKLGATLFRTDHRIFEVVESDLGGDYLDWNLVPLAGETLGREHTLSGLADGYFVLEALLVRPDGSSEKAYTDVVLPEREIDWHFLNGGGGIVRGRGTLALDGQVIPAVAIEKFGAYEQYYVKGHAEAGLSILRQGLAAAKARRPIALDLAYVLRDEKRYSEAVVAFTLAIDADDSTGSDYYYFAERAKLFAKLGDQEAAERDWDRVRRMAGSNMVRNFRGF